MKEDSKWETETGLQEAEKNDTEIAELKREVLTIENRRKIGTKN